MTDTKLTPEKTLYQLNIHFKNSQLNVGLLFRTSERAKEVMGKIVSITTPDLTFTESDDYGHSVVIRLQDVLCVIQTDIKRELQGSEEVQILRAIAQAKLNQRATTDPVLKMFSAPAAVGKHFG